ncbi:MAG: RNA polymerase sigma factor (sigma-70 family) [Gammaproteobacteria bacterium]|jgi:RNA polymerase sigma-70 factor (ECF subfamily)
MSSRLKKFANMKLEHAESDAKDNKTNDSVDRENEPKETLQSISILDTFNKNKYALKKFISRFVVKPEDIEDIAQESFLLSYTAEKTQNILYPKAFIFRVAKNLLLSKFDKKSYKVTDFLEENTNNDRHAHASSEDVEGNVIAQQHIANYCKALASLPPQCRKVMLLKKVYGLKNREIAIRLEISVSCVEKHLKKGFVDCTLFMEAIDSDKAANPSESTSLSSGVVK